MPQFSVARHRTAIERLDLSRPVRVAIEDGLITPETTVVDYGCGRGGDVARLREQGVPCVGWDPAYKTPPPREPAEVVNLGYVINVIENPTERAHALQEAWTLARKVLVVSARLISESNGLEAHPLGDGLLTNRGTFQKFYQQQELRLWVEETLGTSASAAGPGIFYVFRDSTDRQFFLATRHSRRLTVPRLRRSDLLFDQHKELLEQVMQFFTDRGRLPVAEELAQIADIERHFGTLRRAFAVVRRVTGADQWDRIRELRTQDLSVFLALAKFNGRPRLSDLPSVLQLDVKALAGNYSRACQQADQLLYSLGDSTVLQAAFGKATSGRLWERALYVHINALDELPPELRVYEGCAKAYIGRVEGANVVKLHRLKPAITYMSYVDFNEAPHPALVESFRVELHTFDVKYRDFREWDDPPVLLRKDDLVSLTHPLRERFERLARQEEKVGLYGYGDGVSTKRGLDQALARLGVELRGHRLLTRSG